jgi:hypothetical protein
VVNHLHGAPDTTVVRLLRHLEELELVDVYVRHVALVRSHPRCDGALVGVEPLGPMESDLAAGAHLGDVARRRPVASVAGDVATGGIEDREDVSAAKGNAFRARGDLRVCYDVPAGVAIEESALVVIGGSESIRISGQDVLIHCIVSRDTIDVPMSSRVGCEGQDHRQLNCFHHVAG